MVEGAADAPGEAPALAGALAVLRDFPFPVSCEPKAPLHFTCGVKLQLNFIFCAFLGFSCWDFSTLALWAGLLWKLGSIRPFSCLGFCQCGVFPFPGRAAPRCRPPPSEERCACNEKSSCD